MMLLERYAYGNRWRRVNPAAKGLFALSGLTAVFIAKSPVTAVVLALIMIAVAILGTGMSLRNYLKVAAPALLFLATSVTTLLFSLRTGGAWYPSLHLEQGELPRVAHVCGRSLGGLTSLLFLALTTPMNDIIALLRRLKTPEVLLDLMTLCYRMLFVFSESVHDMHTAQASRLGFVGPRRTLRSLGVLTANLTLQVLQRSQALHHAALARNNDGPLRFMPPEYPRSRASMATALLAGSCLIIVATVR